MEKGKGGRTGKEKGRGSIADDVLTMQYLFL